MKIVVVGAGAVGQVYGRHLQLGGADVSLLVKPAHLDEARRGFELYPLNRRRPRSEPVRFEAPVFDSIAAAMSDRPDAVVLCVSSTALRAGNWLDELASELGDATLVVLQPSPGDLDHVRARVAAEQVVAGLIAIVSYPGPLPGEELPSPGTVYWFPPLGRSLFSGARAEPLVDRFRAGGLPAKRVNDLTATQAHGAAVLQTLVIALEIAGWSFNALRRDRELFHLAHAGATEAMRALEHHLGARPPMIMRLARPLPLRLGLGLGTRAAPFDLEGYLHLHFEKVGDQTRLWLDDVRTIAAEAEIPAPALAELARRLDRGRDHGG